MANKESYEWLNDHDPQIQRFFRLAKKRKNGKQVMFQSWKDSATIPTTVHSSIDEDNKTQSLTKFSQSTTFSLRFSQKEQEYL